TVRHAVPLAVESMPFAGEPGVYLPPRIANRFRMFEDARIGHQPKEGAYAGPRQADRTGTVELQANRGPRGAEQMGSSLVGFALGNGEGFANVVETRNAQRAKRD